MVRIELFNRSGNFTAALSHCSQVYEELLSSNADIYHRVRIMIMQAQIYSSCGRPLKGLSTSINAASIAWKARLMPAIFQAFLTIANILIELEEFQSAYTMLDCMMPQVLECEDVAMAAQCFASLADMQIGLAGTKSGAARNKHMHNALEFIDRANSGEILSMSNMIFLLTLIRV